MSKRSGPQRVQLRRSKGYRKPEGAVNVTRPHSKWANPYRTPEHGTPAEVVAMYRAYLLHTPALMTRLDELRGKDLACWCKPGEPCHADVLLELSNYTLAIRDCLDCGIDIYDIDEYYMVYDHVWRAAAGKDDWDGMKLCLGCLSERLGRRLYLDDFKPMPLNRDERTALAILRAVTRQEDRTTRDEPRAAADNVIPLYLPALKLLERDDDLLRVIANSDDPACRRLIDWMCCEMMPAIDFLGLRGPAGKGSYRWPGTRAEFDRMLTEAVNAVQ
jgi:hypothetical protein